LAEQREDPAASLRADRTFNHLAGIWLFKLDALVAALVAVRMILIRDRPLGYFGRGRSPFLRRTEDDSAGSATGRASQQQTPGKSC